MCSPPRTRRARPQRVARARPRGTAHATATVGRCSGCCPQRGQSRSFEKYLVACRVVASRRAGSGGIERIAAKRLQEEIGQWQRVADAVKAA